MTGTGWLELVAVGAAAAIATTGLVTGRAGRAYAVAVTSLLGLALGLVWFGELPAADSAPRVVLLLAGVLAVTGGGLVTTQVFALVDRDARTVRAGEVLRGGAWIGALERLAVFAALVAGWGPGLAIVLAVKGLGRYPELRNQEDTGAAERFIIGTFTSVLWAVACAGLATLAR
ncbi:hypothetical protein [Nocardioides cynanchi]|uniref:hypothetical protein n=1 Tax=Nocardioides cynanchi TaxID=2558918 RepID=UPI0017835AEE|nr:hypothetical protein [Nocardioides cynanchi]